MVFKRNRAPSFPQSAHYKLRTRRRRCSLELLERRELLAAQLLADSSPILSPDSNVKQDVVSVFESASVVQVTDVWLENSGWSEAFLQRLADDGLGHVDHGFRVGSGSQQLQSIPFTGINQVNVKMSQPFNASVGDLELLDDAGNLIDAADFEISDDQTVASWTLATALNRSRVQIRISDEIQNDSGVRLDGDWSDATSSFPSGDGQLGTDFTFGFSILPGDIDRSGRVTVQDIGPMRAGLGATATSPRYSPLADLDGSGRITVADIGPLREFLGQSQSVDEAAPLGVAHLQADTGPTPQLTADLITSDSTISGIVRDVSPIDSLVARVDQGNPIAVALLPDGKFQFDTGLALDGTADGEHVVEFEATDALGNTSVFGIDFVFDTQPPEITLAIPDLVRVTFDEIELNFDEPVYVDDLEPTDFQLFYNGGPNNGQPVEIASLESNFPERLTIQLSSFLDDESFVFEVLSPILDLAGNVGLPPDQVTFTVADPAGISLIAPRSGERDVRLDRPIVVSFDEPIDPDSIDSESFYVDVAGSRVEGEIRVGHNAMSARLIPDAMFPASTTGRIVVDGSRILGADGIALDADGNDEPGGFAQSTYSTVGVTRLPGTSVHGYIYDSTRSDDGEDIPIVGVTLRVEGIPGLTAVTDENGFFRLQDTPGTEFFVQFDMSTVTSAPEGFEYLAPAKPFHPVPGMDVPLGKADGKEFDIYFPLVNMAEGIEVTSGEMTVAQFGEAALDHLEEISPNVPRSEWEKLSVEIPPDSLFFDDGSPASEVQIFALDPDRIPAPLPGGVDPSIVFSIDAGAASDFGTPARLTFPNLDGLAPGEVRPIYTFDHDAGEWKITGRAVASADGSVLETDEGGVTTLGWKGLGQNPDTEAAPPPSPSETRFPYPRRRMGLYSTHPKQLLRRSRGNDQCCARAPNQESCGLIPGRAKGQST